MKNKILKSFSAVLALLMCFILYAPGAFAATQSDLEKQNKELQRQIDEKQSKISGLKNDINKQKEYIQTLYALIDDMNAQMEVVQGKLDRINSDISKTNQKIDAKQNEIDKVQKDINKQKDEINETIKKLCKRLRAAYMAGSSSTLEILLSCEDIASFLTTSEMLKRVSDNDDALVKSLKASIVKLNKSKEKLENDKHELDVEKTNLVSKKNEQEAEKSVYTTKQNQITSKMHEAQNIVNSLDKTSSAYQSAISSYKSQMAANESKIQQIINDAKNIANKPTNSGGSQGNPSVKPDNNTTVSSGKFICPVPYSSAYVSSGWGYRDAFMTASGNLSSSNHGGTDITCNGASQYNKKIVASRAGTVIYASWMSGYGNTVMIDHGDGYVTLYGHNNSISVTNGQYVSQGQQLAIMGMTGNATGPHCHFEIRYNGTKVNPMNYISVP